MPSDVDAATADLNLLAWRSAFYGHRRAPHGAASLGAGKRIRGTPEARSPMSFEEALDAMAARGKESCNGA